MTASFHILPIHYSSIIPSFDTIQPELLTVSLNKPQINKTCWDGTQVACETFCLDDDDTFLEATLALRSPMLSSATVRFVEAKQENLVKGKPPTPLMILEVHSSEISSLSSPNETLCNQIVYKLFV
jgi:hypothetical protein